MKLLVPNADPDIILAEMTSSDKKTSPNSKNRRSCSLQNFKKIITLDLHDDKKEIEILDKIFEDLEK
jgi:hypothetical protein